MELTFYNGNNATYNSHTIKAKARNRAKTVLEPISNPRTTIRQTGVTADKLNLQTSLSGSVMRSNRGFSKTFEFEFQDKINLNSWNKTTKKLVRRNILMLSNVKAASITVKLTAEGMPDVIRTMHPNKLFAWVNGIKLAEKRANKNF